MATSSVAEAPPPRMHALSLQPAHSPLIFLVERCAKKMCTSALCMSSAAAAAKQSPSCQGGRGAAGRGGRSGAAGRRRVPGGWLVPFAGPRVDPVHCCTPCHSDRPKLTFCRPARPPCSTPYWMASRHSCGCCRLRACLAACARGTGGRQWEEGGAAAEWRPGWRAMPAACPGQARPGHTSGRAPARAQTAAPPAPRPEAPADRCGTASPRARACRLRKQAQKRDGGRGLCKLAGIGSRCGTASACVRACRL